MASTTRRNSHGPRSCLNRGRSLFLVVVIVAILLAGCTDSPGRDHQEGDTIPGDDAEGPDSAPNDSQEGESLPDNASDDADWKGNSSFEIAPEDPVLTPGENLTLWANFTNQDNRTFSYRAGGCSPTVIRVGRLPLRITTLSSHPFFPDTGLRACPDVLSKRSVAPGETVSANLTWDGSFRFWNHSALEEGKGWELTTAWASPGPWNLSYGWNTQSSYEVVEETTLTVEEGSGGPTVAPEDCDRVIPGAAGQPIAEANLTVSDTTRAVGENVTISMRYDLNVTGRGCAVLVNTPHLRLDQQGQVPMYPGSFCPMRLPMAGEGVPVGDPALAWLEGGSGSVDLTLSWNGTDPCRGGSVTEGNSTLRLAWGDVTLAERTVRWRSS